ncbi:alpha/beta hydrolase [Streptococcus sp. S784/96/1]|uniref:alpha/beta hydrolase n=1 Tax=Streptococcus sp. S784/96/1 TaxID=2653499 RepID=UPI001389C324|nr:alpha/beta hydrolase [Streptococcus sp. S784/96/1]
MKIEIIDIEDHIGNKAQLQGYLLDNSLEIDPNRKRPAVIICPGGGYSFTSDREAEPVAVKLLQFGFQVFVLRYSVAPIRYPSALIQLAKSVKMVRKNAEKWHVNSNGIIIAGFSAGGHLAANLGVEWHEEHLKAYLGGDEADWQPNGLLLSYPVISSGEYAHIDSFKKLLGEDFERQKEMLSLENRVTEKTPPTFIWHTGEDGLVPAENSLLFVQALRKHQVSAECHLYAFGGHGLSLGTAETAINNDYGVEETISGWIEQFAWWSKRTLSIK